MHGEARASIAKAFTDFARNRDVAFAAELHRMRAVSSQNIGEHDQVESDFRSALKIARQQEARSLELRAARDLARMLAARGKREQAYDILHPVYSAFAEGFDTADLKEAKALLDELLA